MADISYPYREDRSCSGFFEFTNTGVQYADTGVRGLKQYANFDQGPWMKVDSSGTSTYAMDLDAGIYRLSESLTSDSATGGDHRLYRRMRVPRDFGHWLTLTMFARKNNGTVVTSLGVSIYKGATVDPTVNAFSIKPATNNEWQQFTMTPTGNYSPGDFITFEIKLVCTGFCEVFVADLAPLYYIDKVNV